MSWKSGLGVLLICFVATCAGQKPDCTKKLPLNVTCCLIEKMEIKEVVDMCQNETITKAENLKNCTFHSCMMNKVGLFHSNSTTILKDNFMKHLEKIPIADRKMAYKKAAEKCISYVEKKKDMLISTFAANPYNIKKEECNPIPMVFKTCFMVEVNKNCPRDDIVAKNECKDSVNYHRNCPSNEDEMLKEIEKLIVPKKM